MCTAVLHCIHDMRRKPIYAADAQLNELAHTLDTIHFPVDQEHTERYQLLLRAGLGDNFRNTTPRGGKAWGARFFLGGQNRIVGISTNHLKVCRFADMAAVRFWVYKVRSAAPPTEVDLNFGTKSVEWDTTNVSDAVILLDLIENYLVKSGAFPALIKTEAQRQAAIAASKAKRRTVCNEMENFRDGVVTEMSSLERKIDELHRLFLLLPEQFQKLEVMINNAK